MKQIRISIKTSGTLSNYFTWSDAAGIRLTEEDPVELEIEGCLNSEDIIFLREICGGRYLYERKRKTGYVKKLNLEKVRFEADKNAYFTTKSQYGHYASYGTKPKTITSYMFARLETVEEIILPNDTLTIENDAFWNCPAKSIILPDCIETLEVKAFESSCIETIYVNAIQIKNRCFESCYKLKSIFFGKKVKQINGAFNYHNNLSNIEISSDNKHLKIINSCVMNAKETQLILYIQQSNCTELNIQEGIERICGGAFQGGPFLTNIVLPQTLQYIGSGAFLCTKIEELHIPSNVKMITGITFPKSMNRIYFHSSTPPETKGQYFFADYRGDIIIYVPRGCADLYKEKFKRYVNRIQEAEYEPQERKAKKEVKDRAFYKKLVNEIKDFEPINITDPYTLFLKGRFSGKSFLNIWNSNLFYIKWMVRLGKITDIDNKVFVFLLDNFTLKHRAINNLKGLVTISKIKRAKELEEKERIEREYFEYLSEISRMQEEEEEIRDVNRLFEEMMNEYDAWGNID